MVGKVEIVNNEVVIRLPLKEEPSKSGKMTFICQSNGWKPTEGTYKDKTLTINVMVGFKKE